MPPVPTAVQTEPEVLLLSFSSSIVGRMVPRDKVSRVIGRVPRTVWRVTTRTAVEAFRTIMSTIT